MTGRAVGVRILVLVLVAVLAGCAPFNRFMASVGRPGSAAPASGYRTVEPGDTLYSIAWDSGHDYRDLAAWNGIRPPYVIYPGQRLRLAPPPAAGGGGGDWTVHPGDTLYSIARRAGVPYRKLASLNGIAPPYEIHPGQRLRLGPVRGERRARAGSGAAHDSGPAVADDAPLRASFGGWVWPTEGPILSRFTPNGTSKGIDIGGQIGQPIRSAAPGRVVYEGSGLRGYGKLIIIKHSSDFLSAYAHCDKIYVKEGDVIKRGQIIAGMGSTGSSKVELHFEIRYRGYPVNPLKYLPKR